MMTFLIDFGIMAYSRTVRSVTYRVAYLDLNKNQFFGPLIIGLTVYEPPLANDTANPFGVFTFV